jgi:hypothetical protein
MFFRPPRTPHRELFACHERVTPEDQLWQKVRDDFVEDEGSYHAGADVGLEDLSTSDVVRLWGHVAEHVTSVRGLTARFRGSDIEVDDLADAVAQFESEGADYVHVCVNGIQSHGEVLPLINFELWPDSFSMYWWVSHPEDVWTREGVAALARFLGDLRTLVPHAALDYEHSAVFDFGGAVETFLAADASRKDS